jgi:hypothetical protein
MPRGSVEPVLVGLPWLLRKHPGRKLPELNHHHREREVCRRYHRHLPTRTLMAIGWTVVMPIRGTGRAILGFRVGVGVIRVLAGDRKPHHLEDMTPPEHAEDKRKGEKHRKPAHPQASSLPPPP